MTTLTIVIPTRNRADLLQRAVGSLVESASRVPDDIEILVCDNQSTDATAERCADLAAMHPQLRYARHEQAATSAEQSAYMSLRTLMRQGRSEFFWMFGDDDIAHPDACEQILRALRDGHDFVLAGLEVGDFRGPDAGSAQRRPRGYYRVSAPYVRYPRGADLFADFGLVTATTTLSCLCGRLERLDLEAWARLLEVSPIYSHSAAMLLSYRDRPAAVLAGAQLRYTLNSVASELSRLREAGLTLARPSYWPYTTGLLRQLQFLLARMPQAASFFDSVEEIHLSKDSLNLKHGTLAGFVLEMHVRQARLHGESGQTAERLTPESLSELRQFLGTFLGGSRRAVLLELCSRLEAHAEDSAQVLDELLRSLDEVEAEELRARFERSPGPVLTEDSGPLARKRLRGVRVADCHRRLTVAIPTYNRRASVLRQLHALASLGALTDPEVEVLVGDNASDDGTREALDEFALHHPYTLRVVHYAGHVGSAEENCARLVREAAGCYVWLLSDDDVIVRPAYARLRALVARGDADSTASFVFDTAAEQDGERLVNPCTHTMDEGLRGVLDGIEAEGRVEFTSFIERHGLAHYGALISRYVVRRDRLIGAIDPYLPISSIYSHVFGLLERLRDEQVMFVADPLVWRRSSEVLDRFARMARQRGWYFYRPWTRGLVDLAQAFEQRSGVPPGWLRHVRERGGEGVSYGLVEDMVHQLGRQLGYALLRHDRAELLPAEDLDRIASYFRACRLQEGGLARFEEVARMVAEAVDKAQDAGDYRVDVEEFAQLWTHVRALPSRMLASAGAPQPDAPQSAQLPDPPTQGMPQPAAAPNWLRRPARHLAARLARMQLEHPERYQRIVAWKNRNAMLRMLSRQLMKMGRG